jgi:hypothetical protein
VNRPRAIIALVFGMTLLAIVVGGTLAAVYSPTNRATTAALEILTADPALSASQAAASTDAALAAAQAACDTGTPAPITGHASFDDATAAAVVILCGAE